MGKKSSGSAPKAPDYIGAAQEQGRQNIEAARVGAQLNRVNQVGPFGSVSYNQDPNNPDSWTQTTTLDPYMQQLYGATSQNAIDRAGLAGKVGNNLNYQLGQGIDFSGLPGRSTGVGTANYQTGVGADSVAQKNIDLSGLPSLNTDFTGERQRVEDALYNRGASRLDDQFSRADESNRSRLMAQGIREGSEAWNNAMKDFGNQRTDAYGDLRDRSIAAGGSEQSRLFADALAARGQGSNELFGQGQFANQAQQQQFGNEMARANLYNTGQESQWGQRYANAGLQNQARDAGINETLLPRQQLMREYQSLYGDQVQAPSAGIAPVQGPAPVDYMGAVQNQYGAQMDAYNAKQAQNSNFLNSLYGLGGTLGSAAIMMSDRRLKRDFERIGALKNGIPTYRFKYLGSDVTRYGVIADEVRQVMPEAVQRAEDGFDRVNYDMIGGGHLLSVH